VRQAEAQGGIGQADRDAEIAAQRVHVLHDLLLAIGAAEIILAEIASREGGLFGNRAGQRTFVQRDARQDADIHFLRQRQHARFRGLIENVVDHLNGIDQAGAHDGER
jgi:hypothetical protein